jgi:5-methyltetrahydropteroyltriglutamate--homocysteine methyltransferase
MKTSDDHILTTHTGSLPRPEKLVDLVYSKQEGKKVDEANFESLVGKTVDEVVRMQAELGVDVVSDGEVSKPGFVNYINKRLAGFGGVGAPWALGDMDDTPELVVAQYGGAAGQHIMMPECIGPVSYVGQGEVQQDIAHLRHALQQSQPSKHSFQQPRPDASRCVPQTNIMTHTRIIFGPLAMPWLKNIERL